MATLKTGQKIDLSVKFREANLPDGSPGKESTAQNIVWNSSDESIGTVEAAPDGLSAVFTGSAEGNCSVVLTADADMGDGLQEISGSLDCTVTGPNATVVEITAGPPRD